MFDVIVYSLFSESIIVGIWGNGVSNVTVVSEVCLDKDVLMDREIEPAWMPEGTCHMSYDWERAPTSRVRHLMNKCIKNMLYWLKGDKPKP